jgi:hypothetical protein
MAVAYKRIVSLKKGASHGQAMIESVLVMIVACLCFLALFQYANLFAAKMTLTHAATRAARARTVGLNHWMVEKAARAASIPVSGKSLIPFGVPTTPTSILQGRRNPGAIWNAALSASPTSAKAQLERARIPEYMGSVNSPTSREILNYERWDEMSLSMDEPLDLDGSTPGVLEVTVHQRQPLFISFLSLMEGAFTLDAGEGQEESVTMRGTYSMECQYPLYMENMNW